MEVDQHFNIFESNETEDGSMMSGRWVQGLRIAAQFGFGFQPHILCNEATNLTPVMYFMHVSIYP
jgi:hypothetical protein